MQNVSPPTSLQECMPKVEIDVNYFQISLGVNGIIHAVVYKNLENIQHHEYEHKLNFFLSVVYSSGLFSVNF